VIVYTPPQLARMRTEGSATRCHFGGDSSSAQTTSNTDARVVGGDTSTNVSAAFGGSGNTLEITDRGAVSDSMALAKAGIESQERVVSTVIDNNANMLAGVLDQQRTFADTVKSTANKDTNTIIFAGLAVVGVAAAMMLRRG